jgi:hypothetical protein
MLHSLDLLIGFATVMAALSLVVTVLTQIVADALQLRANRLRDGLLEVLGHAGIELQEARKILDASHLSGRTEVTAAELSAVAGGADFQNVFDFAMRDTSAQFTLQSRLIVAALSIAVAVGLPLDMLDLFRTLSSGEGVLIFPQTLAGWALRWHEVNVAGIAGSAVLLSLGAPFWFEVLRDLLNLKGAQAK